MRKQTRADGRGTGLGRLALGLLVCIMAAHHPAAALRSAPPPSPR